jgi:small subunit ribosomal protein S16
MALVIRLRKQGRRNRESFRLVLADERSPRDGKYIEKLGWYDPFIKDKNLIVDAERVWFWINVGAQVSERVQSLFRNFAPEVMQKWAAKKAEKKSH